MAGFMFATPALGSQASRQSMWIEGNQVFAATAALEASLNPGLNAYMAYKKTI